MTKLNTNRKNKSKRNVKVINTKKSKKKADGFVSVSDFRQQND